MEALIVIGVMAVIVNALSSAGSSSSKNTTSSAAGGSGRYRFEHCKVGDEWRAYIYSQPSYGALPSDAHSSHRLTDSRGKYVCWSAPVRTRAESEAVAKYWAVNTDEYIASGRWPSG